MTTKEDDMPCTVCSTWAREATAELTCHHPDCPVWAEKARRMYYQGIVYEVCNALDRIFRKRPGSGVVCGTAETPTRQVQDLLPQIEARCKEWAEMKAKSQTGDEPTHAVPR